jgi:hypothetical protein
VCGFLGHERFGNPIFPEVPMMETRRRMLASIAGAAVVLPAETLLTWLQGTGPVVKPHPYPDGRDPSAPPVLDSPSRVNPRAIEMENQKELRANVRKLYDLVVELKEQVEKTDANSTLSIPVMKKAQQIEKLAKQIKNLARG